MTQAQEITDTSMTITPAEFGAQVVLSDLMMMTVRDEFFRVAGRVLADSFIRQQEQVLCDDFDNYAVALGSAGTALTVGHAMAGNAAIKYNPPADGTAGRGGEPAPDPTYLIHTPAGLHSLAKNMAGGIGATGATQNAPNLSKGSFELVSVPGMTIKSSIDINKDSSDDAKGGLFSKEAQILVELGGGPGVEKERDASLRGWELNFVGRWARGEYLDLWGREMNFDSARPTS